LIRCRPDAPPESAIRLITRILVAAYLIEAGLLLALAPWTALWDRNFFARTVPMLGDWMASGFVRGGVSGIGVITTVAGLRDLAASFVGRPSAGGAGDDRP
jgi:hypothetical protein